MCSPSSNDCFHNFFLEHFLCTRVHFVEPKVKLQEFEGLLERVRPFKKDEAIASDGDHDKGKRIRTGYEKMVVGTTLILLIFLQLCDR